MQTTNVSQNRRLAQVLFFSSQVGQSDNAPCPTTKLAPTLHLTAGRHEKEKPHTHAHTRENIQKVILRRLKLYKTPEKDFLQAIPMVFEQVYNTKVIFHNNDYVDSIYQHYTPQVADIFLQWVKTFALMRSSYRESAFQGVIFSDDNDFLSAFQMIKANGAKPRLKPKNYEKIVWQAIQEHFPKEEFERIVLTRKLIISSFSIVKVLNNLTDKGMLTKRKKRGFSSHFYQVVTH
jgi:hypothetical protein